MEIKNLSSPFIIKTSISKNTNTSLETQCIYWDTVNLHWSNFGCTLVSLTNTSVECACNHLTDFAARFTAIGDENRAIFENAGAIFSKNGLEKFMTFFIFIGTFFASLLLLFIYLTRVNSIQAVIYARNIAKYSELSLLKMLTQKPDTFFMDRYYPNIKLHPKKLKNTPKVKPYKGTSFFNKLIHIWKWRILYQHPYFSVFTNFDPRISKQLRGLQLFIFIVNTLFITCLLYGYSHTSVQGQMNIIESLILSILTSTINTPIIMCFNIVIYYIGIKEYTWRYPYLSQELISRHTFENSLVDRDIDSLVNELATELAAIRKKIPQIIKYEESIGLVKLRDNFEYANSIIRQIELLPNNDISTIVPQEEFTSSASEFWGALPVHTPTGWAGVICGFLYLIWCFIYILMFGAYQSDSNHIFYNFISTEMIAILILQPLILFLTPLFGGFSSYIFGLCSKNNTKKSYSNIYFFSDPDATPGKSTALSISLGYLLFLRGIAETNSNKHNRLNMEIAVAPSKAIINSLNDMFQEDVKETTITMDRERIISALYYSKRVRSL